MSSQQTRDQVLRAAAKVFARRGYDGATIAEIAATAKVSSGAIYAHYDGKAELFLAVLRTYVQREAERRLHDDRPLDVGDLIAEAGANLDRQPAAERTLLIEAIMTAKHDAKVRRALSQWFREQHEFIAASIVAAQRAGRVTADFSPLAAARFSSTVMLGSLVLDVLDVPGVEHDDWAAFVTQVVDNFRPARRPASSRRAAGRR
ncbi:MAG TPA: TetR/AcrR family transcriptional regulator [Mycobacteriales bacterium]|nr:TetR/AcrR family transcriptional regulator [Mycobacteriales bacterium]